MNIFESLFWGKEAEVEDMLIEHLELVNDTLDKFGEGMKHWVENGDLEVANEIAFQTHRLEGTADDKRREIEKKLLEGALLARSRSEMLDLIERTDKLANAAEAAMDFALLQEIRIPEELKPLTKDIIDKTLEIMNAVQNALLGLFQGEKDTLKYTKKIEHQEGEVDDMERNYIQNLFQLDLDLAEKILLRQYLEALVEVSDRAEDLSDDVEILVATRKA